MSLQLRRISLLMVLAVLVMPTVVIAGAFPVTVVYSEIDTSDTSLVPGLGGARFDSFDRPYRSPDGSMWIMSASSDLGTSEDEVILVGTTVDAMGNTVVREGTAAGWAPGENVGLIDRNMSINDAGSYAFSTNTDGATGADEYIVKYDAGGGVFSAAAQEGQGIPGFDGNTWGLTLNSALITNDGSVGWRATSTVGDLISDEDDFLWFGGGPVAQEGVSIPSGQLTGLTEVWDNFDSEDYYTNSTGSNFIAMGDLSGDTGTDDVLVVGDIVVAQEGFVIPGSDFVSPLETILEPYMSSSGDWMARGDNDDQQDWLLLNGIVIAATGDDVPGGLPGETFSDALFSGTFFTMLANNVGDYIYGATTSNDDPEADAVLVYNGEQVLLRQGDPVDLDGNGLYDDGVFIDIFNNDDGFLTDDNWFYFTAELIDVTGAGVGQAFLRLQVPEPTSLSLLAIGGLLAMRRRKS